jgi:hypothetical protein
MWKQHHCVAASCAQWFSLVNIWYQAATLLKSHVNLIVILEGLWYARIDPIQLIGPQSIVLTTHVLTITKDMQNIMPMYSQAKPIKEASNLFSKKAIVSIVLKLRWELDILDHYQKYTQENDHYKGSCPSQPCICNLCPNQPFLDYKCDCTPQHLIKTICI